jgi:putative inorganic carbon (HCO3(-)) transporter
VSRLRLATIGFVLAGCALAVIGLLGTKWFSKFPALAAVIAKLPQAIRGVPGAEEGFHPNAVAGCLILFVPLQVGLLAGHTSGWLADGWMPEGRQAWGRAMQGALLMLTAGTLALTQSRGAWFGLGVAILGVLLIHSRRTRLVAMAVGACTILAATALGPERIFNLAVSQSGPGMAGNVTGRVELWSRAVYGIHDFPLTGMGMNMFRRVIQLVYPTFLTSPGFDVAHAHNHLLQTALDLGIPGLIAYLAIWMVVLTLLVLVYHRAPERWARVMAGGLIAGLIAHFSFSMTDAIPLGAKVGVLFWLTLALGVALHQMALPMRRQTEKPAAAASS